MRKQEAWETKGKGSRRCEKQGGVGNEGRWIRIREKAGEVETRV